MACSSALSLYSLVMKARGLTDGERMDLYMGLHAERTNLWNMPTSLLYCNHSRPALFPNLPLQPSVTPQLLPVQLCQVIPPLTTVGFLGKICCLADCHVSRHRFQGSLDVTQIFLLYHSTEWRANSCCSVDGVTCDLRVQFLFPVLLLLSQGRPGGGEG